MAEYSVVLVFALVCFEISTGTTAPSNDIHSELINMQSNIMKLMNQTESLAKEVQLKNDQTQFLQDDVKVLNKSLVAEQQKSANLEARVASLETQLRNTIASFGETQADLRSTKNKVNSLQIQLTSAKAIQNQLLTDQASLNASFTQTVSALNLSILAAAQNTKEESDVYFSTRGLDLTSNFTNGSPLQYQVIVSNTGNGYDKTSGVFTAPSDGIYWFSVTLSGSTDDHVSCYLMKNSMDYLVEVYISAFSAYASASTSTLVHLTSGDKVSVSQCNGSGVLSSYKSSFSGFMV